MLGFLDRSVRYRLIAVIMATTLAALVVASAALLTYEVNNYRDFLVADATTQADIVALTTAPMVVFDDPEAAAENLAPLTTRANIRAAAIYTPDGELFAATDTDGELNYPPLPKPLGSRFAGGELELFHPILYNNELIGIVFLSATYDLAGRIKDYLLILGAVMLLSLVVAGVISLRLQSGVTAPVLAVSRVARKVVEQRDFTHRAKKTTNDEIGVLVDSFNAMLAEVGRMTEALERTNRRLRTETDERRSAEQALRAADRRKDEFLATLAHELRNPLAPMVNALSLIHASALDDDGKRAHDIIDRQLAHMVRLVDDLLDVSRITRGKLAVQMTQVELASVVQSAIDTARPVIEAHGHTLEVDLPDRPVHVEGDPVRLSQVFSNLLNNAAKYTEKGGNISLSAVIGEDHTLEIVVEDDGIGMSQETLAAIFEMFTQGAGDKTRRTHSGLGVGLALSRRLIELHGGRIEASSPGPGLGSRFTVTLTAMPGAAPVSVGSVPVDEAVETPAGSRRILLVDDNVDFATSLAVLLETLGHDVRVAHDVAGAVDAAAQLKPEVAFLDIGLPEISGYEVATRLRALPACAETTMIALSGWGQVEDRRRSEEAGFADHLVKPVDLKTIEKALAALATD